jgi:hypothetical protein
MNGYAPDTSTAIASEKRPRSTLDLLYAFILGGIIGFTIIAVILLVLFLVLSKNDGPYHE